MKDLFIAVLFCLTSVVSLAQSAAIEGIKKNFDRQAACWNAGDLECYMEAYAPEGRIQTVSRAGITTGYDSILNNYKKYFPPGKMGKLHFDEFQFTKLGGKYHYVVGRFNLNLPGRDELLQGYFSVLMKRIKGDWYIVSDHSS